MFIKSILARPVLCGFISISIWSYLAVVITMLGNIPPFEMLFFSTAIGFTLTSIQITMQKRWHIIRAPLDMWVAGSLFLVGTNLLYVSAFQFAPPVHAELINYIWPLFVVIGGSVFFKEKLTPKHMIGIALCVLSMFALHFDHLQNIHGVTLRHMYGYGFALMGAVTCSAYTLVSKKHATVPNQIVGMYAGAGAVLCLIGHVLFEKTVVPSNFEFMLLVLLGASAHWISFQTWDRAIKNLEAWKICVIAYFTPSFSVTLLIVAGFGVFSWPLAMSCALLFVGSVLTSAQASNKKEADLDPVTTS